MAVQHNVLARCGRRRKKQRQPLLLGNGVSQFVRRRPFAQRYSRNLKIPRNLEIAAKDRSAHSFQ
jgi:hypothetical protein